MPLFEYLCDFCKMTFEQITSASDQDSGKCPKCHAKNCRKQISSFKVAGRGDLRESTFHGCHGEHHPSSGHSHDSRDSHNSDDGEPS